MQFYNMYIDDSSDIHGKIKSHDYQYFGVHAILCSPFVQICGV